MFILSFRFVEIRGVIAIRPVPYTFLVSFSPTRISREVPDSFQLLGVPPEGLIGSQSLNRIKVRGRRDPRVVGVHTQRSDGAHPCAGEPVYTKSSTTPLPMSRIAMPAVVDPYECGTMV